MKRTRASWLQDVRRHLRDERLPVRSAAIEQLARRGEAASLRLLVELLRDRRRSTWLRCEVAEALGRVRHRAVIPPLVDALKDPEALIRLCAAESLGQLAATEAVAPLTALLRDADSLVRGYAADSLGKLGIDASVLRHALARERSPHARVRIVASLVRMGRNSPRALLHFLGARDYRVRCSAANLLAEVTPRRTKPATLAAIRARLATEPTPAARSSLEYAVRCLQRP